MGRKISNLMVALFFFVLLALVLYQKQTSYLKIEKLSGAFNIDTIPAFNSDSLLKGSYQSAVDSAIETSLPFRPLLIRLNNQIDFSLFERMHAKLSEIGKDGYLFEDNYLKAYKGIDFVGEEKIRKNLNMLEEVRKKLAEKNVHFIFVLEPSKARFYSEKIPDKYRKLPDHISNYEVYRDLLKKEFTNIDVIDFNDYFLKMKDTTSFSLYPKGGTHWSCYSAISIVADSLLTYMEKVSGKVIGDIRTVNVTWSKDYRDPDDDIAKGLNLIFPYPGPEMPYPEIKVTPTPADKKPGLLVVADSYYWIIYYSEVFTNLFSPNNFWYYYEDKYPDYEYELSKQFPGLLQKDILSHDFVILMVTEINLSSLLNFPSKTLSILDPENKDVQKLMHDREVRIQYYIQLMKINPEWHKMMLSKASQQNKSLEEVMRTDAEYMVNLEESKK